MVYCCVWDVTVVFVALAACCPAQKNVVPPPLQFSSGMNVMGNCMQSGGMVVMRGKNVSLKFRAFPLFFATSR